LFIRAIRECIVFPVAVVFVAFLAPLIICMIVCASANSFVHSLTNKYLLSFSVRMGEESEEPSA
jgi:hypothetical protein